MLPFLELSFSLLGNVLLVQVDQLDFEDSLFIHLNLGNTPEPFFSPEAEIRITKTQENSKTPGQGTCI